MQSGRLDQWISIESETISRDAIGGAVRSWATAVETWARTRVVGGQQLGKSGKVTHETGREFVVRRQDVSIHEAMRIVWNNRNWRIESIDDGSRSNELKIMTTSDK